MARTKKLTSNTIPILRQVSKMAFKLKTSKKTDEIFRRIENSENLPCYTLVKLAIALSIHSDQPLNKEDFETNTFGRELNRQTITGDADVLYKCLIQMQEHKHLTDEEYFPLYIKAHIDRGAVMLENEQKYGSKFLVHLSELEKSI